MPHLLIALAAAGAVVSPMSNASALDRAVAEYDLAQEKGDGAALRRLLADDYVLVNSGGAVQTREEVVRDLTAPDFHMAPFTVLRPISRTWRGGALRGGVALLSGTSGGRAFSACLRFVDVWRFADGRWQVAYSQAAKSAADDCTA